jgi:hypothetical protein
VNNALHVRRVTRKSVVAANFATMCAIIGCSSQSSTVPQDAGSDIHAHDAKSEAAADAAPRPPTGTQLDRAGRAAIIFLLVPDDGGARNAYNATDTFLLNGGGPFDISIKPDFTSALSKLDGLDSKKDWPVPSPLAAPFTTDALLLDTSKPFSPTSYLDIEYTTFALDGGAYASCGGRWPGEDAIEKTLSILVRKQLTGVSDGVKAPTKAPSLAFPYLAAPN